MPRKEGRLPPVAVEKTREEHRVVTGFHKACRAVHRQLDFDELLADQEEPLPGASAPYFCRRCSPFLHPGRQRDSAQSARTDFALTNVSVRVPDLENAPARADQGEIVAGRHFCEILPRPAFACRKRIEPRRAGERISS